MVSSVLLLFLLGVTPSLLWLIFFLLEDRKRPEPRTMIAEVFSAGIVAAVVAAVLEKFIANYMTLSSFWEINISAEFMVFSLIEETIVFLAAYLMVGHNKFHDHMDPMIYLITAALGFAALENVSYLLSAGPAVAVHTILIRSVGATLLHAVASGFVGFYWAEKKLAIGIIVATVIHFSFNYLAFFFAQQEAYSIAFVLLCSFFIFHDFDILRSEDNGGISKQG
ncbi:MAG: PrsW family glutamic-type intramembrane protease [Patescibacteria group bacterium]|nr:PrsW family glutamic-type intramembrane protease [Patescibacteria group bacterium]MCL5224463.1 PrsW family glutamic-type intramembrane protease [Patescibacteria group bacterium]